MGCGLRGQFFHVDPGYFRRICYARGRECGLPKALACPRALRNTRAVELLRGGVPITVVKEILGQSSLNLTAGFQQFSQGEAASIVRTAQQAMCKQTSARNAFVGTVIDVERDSIMSQVVMETRTGVRISAVITTESQRNLKSFRGVLSSRQLRLRWSTCLRVTGFPQEVRGIVFGRPFCVPPILRCCRK